jgi:hypothetical protein
MRRRRIKPLTNAKKPKGDTIYPNLYTLALAGERANRKEEEANKVGDLIADGKFDPDRIEDYNYVAAMAREIGWSVGRLKNAIKEARVEEVIKKGTTPEETSGE